jgi:predicted naringenin-chalcone synthase
MMQPEAHIAGIGVATPYPIDVEQLLKIDQEVRQAHNQPEQVINNFQSFVRGTGIHTRHVVHPFWLKGLAEWANLDDHPNIPPGALKKDIFTPNNFIPAYYQRMEVFEETCVKMGIEAARRALLDWGGNPQDITHIITTCTSGWSEPGLAVGVIKALNLSLDCAKAELNFNGCFCGATCLRMARDTVRSGHSKAVLVVAVEVASTHYDVNAVDPSSLVAYSLFADGAAAMVLAPEGQWRYEQTGMSLLPNSTDLLGLKPPTAPDHVGYRMHLDRHVGERLGQYFREGLGKDLLNKLHPSTEKIFPALAIHPGGPRILDNLKRELSNRGWADNAMQTSYDTLQSFGNLGAAAMLFVLAKTIYNIQENELITMAFGPGVTIEWAKLSRVC